MEFKVIESAKDPLFNEALKLYDDTRHSNYMMINWILV